MIVQVYLLGVKCSVALTSRNVLSCFPVLSFTRAFSHFMTFSFGFQPYLLPIMQHALHTLSAKQSSDDSTYATSIASNAALVHGLGTATSGGQLTNLKFRAEVRNCIWRFVLCFNKCIHHLHLGPLLSLPPYIALTISTISRAWGG